MVVWWPLANGDVSRAYRKSAAKRSKTHHLVPASVFKTSLTDFELPSSSNSAVVIKSQADLTRHVALYQAGREQFVRVNNELKGIKATIQNLGTRYEGCWYKRQAVHGTRALCLLLPTIRLGLEYTVLCLAYSTQCHTG